MESTIALSNIRRILIFTKMIGPLLRPTAYECYYVPFLKLENFQPRNNNMEKNFTFTIYLLFTKQYQKDFNFYKNDRPTVYECYYKLL